MARFFRPLLQRSLCIPSRPMASQFSSQARPLIAVVAQPNCPSLEHMPKNPPCDILMVGQTEADLETQTAELAKASGILFIASPGLPSAPSDILNTLWSRVPQVTWVHSFMAGVDALKPFIDQSLKPAADRVSLSNGRGAFSDSLAEYALTAMLHFNKQVPRIQEQKKQKIWHNFVMDVMANKTVGLVGYGSIGSTCGAAAKRAFGCRIVACKQNPTAQSDEIADHIYKSSDVNDMLAECDFVISSLPSTAGTQKFMGAPQFAAMKDSAVLISIGRGATIDEEALAAALKDGVIRGAALDVFAKEPLVKESPFWELDNVLLTPHNADFTTDYFDCGWRVWSDNLKCFIDGAPFSTPVDLEAGY